MRNHTSGGQNVFSSVFAKNFRRGGVTPCENIAAKVSSEAKILWPKCPDLSKKWIRPQGRAGAKHTFLYNAASLAAHTSRTSFSLRGSKGLLLVRRQQIAEFTEVCALAIHLSHIVTHPLTGNFGAQGVT